MHKCCYHYASGSCVSFASCLREKLITFGAFHGKRALNTQNYSYYSTQPFCHFVKLFLSLVNHTYHLFGLFALVSYYATSLNAESCMNEHINNNKAIKKERHELLLLLPFWRCAFFFYSNENSSSEGYLGMNDSWVKIFVGFESKITQFM